MLDLHGESAKHLGPERPPARRGGAGGGELLVVILEASKSVELHGIANGVDDILPLAAEAAVVDNAGLADVGVYLIEHPELPGGDN